MTKEILHHGLLTGQFETILSGTDYFYFWCKQCQALAEITAVLIDNQGRIIFNLKCPKCGALDALKTAVYNRAIHISPQWKKNVRKHWWDDY